MSEVLTEMLLARHGETEWALLGKHTGRKNLPLTLHGEEEARRLGRNLTKFTFEHVFTSPLQRAFRTCELAGVGSRAEVMDDLMEWDYGDFEGLTSAQIHQNHPGWQLFRDGCPGGESVSQVSQRADRVIAHIRALKSNVLVVSHGHFIRALALRWCDIDLEMGSKLLLQTATLSAVGYDRHLDHPVLRYWNAPLSAE